MKAKKESSRKVWRFAVVYTLCLLCLFSATTVVLLQTLRHVKEAHPEGETKEIYVYLPQEEPNTPLDTESNPEEPEKEDDANEEYFVKEYRGQIGIFSVDGTLLEILDTYVKTLPEADRALLGEGVSIKTKEALNAIIEDYSH